MGMPTQLARAKRRLKRLGPRPIVETLKRIDVADLCRFDVFPNNWHDQHYLELPFKYPFVRNLVISLENIEVNHLSGYTQSISLRWCRTGFGGNSRRRPLLVCQCGRSVTKLYLQDGSLKCSRCTNAVYASQVCGKHSRPILQAKRLRAFLELKSYMRQSNRQRLKAHLATAPKGAHLTTKRLANEAIQLPQGNYRTRGAMHWA
jgi:hypothetical protein